MNKETPLKEVAKELYDAGMPCNCDLDNWQPEPTTAHSHVCRIHKTAHAIKDKSRRFLANYN